MGKSLMLVGTASNVGKSVLCAAFCRIFHQDGYRVAPFKAQNMSLNSAATPTGKEIGRAQAVQAEACGILPHEHMNPVLLKPSGLNQSQVVLQGKVHRNFSAADYFHDEKKEIWQAVTESYQKLSEQYEIVVIEGAGSPVEMNLKSRDIANMRTAEMADAPVLLVADIDRGGVFASVVGTLQLLPPHERKRLKGILINKFRGDMSLFEEGIVMMEQLTGLPVVGVIPFIDKLHIDEEDSVALASSRYRQRRLKKKCNIQVAVIPFPYLANYTDIDPLFDEVGVDAFFCERPEELEEVDAVVLPGTKNTMNDMAWLRENGWCEAISRASSEGKWGLGICGGYQMLGQKIMDPNHFESHVDEQEGLGLWDAVTILKADKRTVPAIAILNEHPNGKWQGEVTGYEIHMGQTRYHSDYLPFAKLVDKDGYQNEGCVSPNGRWIGTYLHGILHNDGFRKDWMNAIRMERGLSPLTEVNPYNQLRQDAYDQLAEHVRHHANLDRIYSMVFCKDRGD